MKTLTWHDRGARSAPGVIFRALAENPGRTERDRDRLSIARAGCRARGRPRLSPGAGVLPNSGQPSRLSFKKRWPRFPRSPGERAGVRAGNTTPYFMKTTIGVFISHIPRFVSSASALSLLALFLPLSASAQDTNGLSRAEMQGRELVQKILSQRPAENFTNHGVLKIRNARRANASVPLVCETTVGDGTWSALYRAGMQELKVTHTDGRPNQYVWHADNGKIVTLADNQTMCPFADSDFWVADLGLEFFQWPGQKVLRKEVHRSCGCSVLESTNPNPTTNGYARVETWIDSDSLGIVEANAYDASGQQIKNFYPKDFKKVNGQYQVESMVMINEKTDTRTRLVFDLSKEAKE